MIAELSKDKNMEALHKLGDAADGDKHHSIYIFLYSRLGDLGLAYQAFTAMLSRNLEIRGKRLLYNQMRE